MLPSSRNVAKVWGPDNGFPMLALHGWQDNAGSFDTLAPLLPANIRLVCLDFCGTQLLQVKEVKKVAGIKSFCSP